MSKFIPQVISFENKNKAEDRTLIVSYDFPLYFLIEIKHPETPQNALAYRILETVKEKEKYLSLAVEQNWKLVFEHDEVNVCATITKTNKGFSYKELFGILE